MKKYLQKLFLITLVLAFSSTDLCNAADGKDLYLKNCASCHGAEGEGGKGPALNRQSFLSIATDVYLGKSMIYGRPTRGCPSRKDLSKEEILSIASFIRAWQKDKSITLNNKKILPIPSERGSELFAICAGCHDADGRGAMGPSLVDPGFQASASDGFIIATITYGREGTPMVGFSKEKGHVPPLSEEDIEELASYIRYLGNERKKQ